MDVVVTKDPGTGADVEVYGKITQRFDSGKADIVLIDTADFGEMLIIDGEIQSAAADERAYHTALVGPAIRGYEGRVVILGGGEGCTAREVLAGAPQAHVDQYDYDRGLVEWCADMLRHWNAGSYDNPRVNLHFEDVWSADLPDADSYIIDLFDVTSDTAKQYLELVAICVERLRPNGRLTAYLGDDCDALRAFVRQVAKIFDKYVVSCYTVHIPSYGNGESLLLYMEQPVATFD
jgi:spermidine synthase